MDNNFLIEKMLIGDAESVFEIEKKLIGTGSLEDIKKSIDSDVLHYFVLKQNNKVLGFLEISCLPPEIELFDIAIDSMFVSKNF